MAMCDNKTVIIQTKKRNKIHNRIHIMKRHLILTFMAIALLFSCAMAAKVFRITDIHGEVKANGFILKRGNTVAEKDEISARNTSIIKITDNKTSYTLKVTGSGKTVKQLIAALPDKYESAVNGIRRNLNRTTLKKEEYGMVTMASESIANEVVSNYDIHDNEAIVICKEDSLGNLRVIFMRYGMTEPLAYKIPTASYNYLLRTDIISSKGSNFAYEYTAVYETLWKPLEKYIKPGDTVIYSLVPYLSDIDMSRIKVDDNTRMGDLYDLFWLEDNSDAEE